MAHRTSHHTPYTTHFKLLSAPSSPSLPMPHFELHNTPIDSTVLQVQILTFFREICNIDALPPQTSAALSARLKSYQDLVKTENSPSIFHKLLTFCSIKLGLCELESKYPTWHIDPDEEMKAIPIDDIKHPTFKQQVQHRLHEGTRSRGIFWDGDLAYSG